MCLIEQGRKLWIHGEKNNNEIENLASKTALKCVECYSDTDYGS